MNRREEMELRKTLVLEKLSARKLMRSDGAKRFPRLKNYYKGVYDGTTYALKLIKGIE